MCVPLHVRLSLLRGARSKSERNEKVAGIIALGAQRTVEPRYKGADSALSVGRPTGRASGCSMMPLTSVALPAE